MLHDRSIVKIADNSGGQIGRIFKVLGGSKRRYAEIGDEVIISIQTAQPHTRMNDQGKELTLKLLTSNRPETYAVVANVIKKQWEALGARVVLDIPQNKKEFEDKLLKRDYDVALFGQSLFDNLDSYPYWHSSQIQERDNPKDLKLDSFNLSQYASFEADSLLAKIRETSDQKSRSNSLKELNELWKKDVPALVLYSPLNVFGYDENVYGVNLGKLSLHADRFAHFGDWYVTTRRRFLEGRGWLHFPGWLLGLLARG
jgi:ABC-type transport system substrate-binding protein